MKINIEIELEKIKLKQFNSEEEKNKELESLYKISNDNENLLFELGKSYFLLNKFDLAIVYLLKVLQINKCNINSIDLLNKSYKSQNKIYKSLRLLYKYRQFLVDIADEEIVSIYLNNNRYDLLIKYIYKYMNGEHPSKNNFYKYALSAISRDNFKNNRQNVIKFSKKILKYIDKKNNVKFYNSVLNELEIAQRKIILKSYPRRMTISLISTCNLRCKMCPYDKDRLFKLSKYQVDDIIEMLPYIEEIEWNGGEAFLFEYFNELLDAAYKNNVKQYVTSNGLLINDTYAEKIVKYDVDLTLSIDSVDKELYENIRFGAKFDLLLKRIEKINYFAKKYNKSINLSINSVLSQYNYKYKNNFFDIIKFAKKYGFSNVRISMDLYDKDKELLFNILCDFNKYKTDLIKLAQDLNINLQFIMPSVENFFDEYHNTNGWIQIKKYKKKETYNFKHSLIEMFSSAFWLFYTMVFSKKRDLNKEYGEIKNEKFYNPILCSLPFKKFILSFKGDFKPECVCPEFISHISSGKHISYIYGKIRHFIFNFIYKMENPILDELIINKYKYKYDFIPFPVYKNIKECWNGKEILEMRKRIYINNLDCLKNCCLSDEVKHNI